MKHHFCISKIRCTAFNLLYRKYAIHKKLTDEKKCLNKNVKYSNKIHLLERIECKIYAYYVIK